MTDQIVNATTSIEFTADAALADVGPLAPARPDCPTHRTRALMVGALEKALEQNLSYIDHLIEKLQKTQTRLRAEVEQVTLALNQHYDFAAESLAFADLVEERLVSIGRNGRNRYDHRENAPAQPETTAADGDPRGDVDQPVHGDVGAGVYVPQRGRDADVSGGERELPTAGYRE
ncbi:MAG TPA: hypothetical protein VN325_23145 [Steroidobacteraceae bacterium]|nr:hypothetical protein [Steroidobacteraceae bacterium]